MAVSLKVKLLALTVALVTLALALQSYVSIRAFRADKIAFVYETILAGARSAALVAKAEIEAGRTRMTVQPEIREQTGDVNPPSRGNDPTLSGQALSWVSDYIFNTETGDFAPVSEGARHDDLAAQTSAQLLQNASTFDIAISPHPTHPLGWFLAAASAAGASNGIRIGAFDAGGLMTSLATRNVFNLYIVNSIGKIVLQSGSPNFSIPISDVEALGLDAVKTANKSSLVKELNIGSTPYLVGLAPVGQGGLSTLAVMPMNVAMQAVQTIEIRSIALLVALLGLTLLAGVVGASGIIFNLKRLAAAMVSVTQGDFDVKLETKSKDEVGSLTHGFNFMIGEVKRLLIETADKARMETELETAKTVQSTLFLPAEFDHEKFSINGFYEPATECGGDWWYYGVRDNKLRFWLGDATGHGAPAALTTSAVRSALSVVENLKVSSMADAASLLNRAIHDTTKGRIMMTFFMAELDLETRMLTYVLASHEPPILLKKKDEAKLTRKDLEFLQEARGPRLGDRPAAVFEVAELRLQPGDFIIVYTDGVLDAATPAGEQFGERKLLKTIVDSRNQERDTAGVCEDIRTAVEEQRQGTPLVDDMTWVVIGVK